MRASAISFVLSLLKLRFILKGSPGFGRIVGSLFRNLLQNSRKTKVERNPHTSSWNPFGFMLSLFLRYPIWKQSQDGSVLSLACSRGFLRWTCTDSAVRWIASDSRCGSDGTVTDHVLSLFIMLILFWPSVVANSLSLANIPR
jgi:hypothetical protein